MVFAAISITSRCNFKCRMCDIGQRNLASTSIAQSWRADEELSAAQWEEILRRLAVERVHIMAVEPLLYPQFDELLDRCKAMGVKVWLTTNGWFLAEHIEALARCCENVAVSIDGLESTHDRIRGVPGAFRRAIEGVAALRNAAGDGLTVRVSFAVTPENTSEMIELYDQVDALGARIIFNHYNYIHPDSCIGYECRPSNMTVYDPKDVSLDELNRAVAYCERAAFLPELRGLRELRKYYQRVPTRRRKRRGGCRVLNEQRQGRRYGIAADGRFVTSARCWYDFDFGNALTGTRLPRDNDALRQTAEDIARKGFPPPCQRLCCAGKLL